MRDDPLSSSQPAGLVSTMWSQQLWVEKFFLDAATRTSPVKVHVVLRTCIWPTDLCYLPVNKYVWWRLSLWQERSGEVSLTPDLWRMWAGSVCLCCPCQSIKLGPYISLFLKAFDELHDHCFKKHTRVTTQLESRKKNYSGWVLMP